MSYEERERQAVRESRQERTVVAFERQASALERCAKALEDLYRNVELCTEPENFKHPDQHGTVFKVRKAE